VSNATEEVKSQVSDLTQVAQEQASSFLGEQKGMAAERIGGVANALRSAGHELAENDESMLAQYTDSLAGQLDRFSNTLRDREIGSLIDDAKQLAHRQPELFVAGALAAGFVLGRFFKSSRNSRNYQNTYSEYDPRDPSRMYGEQYGQGYGSQFSRSRGPEYSRDFDAGYRSGYQQEYGSQFNQGSSGEYGSQYGNQYGNPSRDQLSGQGSSSQIASNQWSQGNIDQSARNTSPSNVQNPNIGNIGNSQSSSHQSGQASGQVSTFGTGTGQSVDQQSDLRKGQEFGQGEEQVSNYKGNDTQKASQTNNRADKEEGEIR
jgi:hypothetical protein